MRLIIAVAVLLGLLVSAWVLNRAGYGGLSATVASAFGFLLGRFDAELDAWRKRVRDHIEGPTP